MTGHARALDLAGASPAFRLDPAEARELAAHLHDCPDCARTAARMRTDAAALGAIDPAVSPRLHDRLQEVAVSAPRSGPNALGIVLALFLLAAGVVGASLGVGALVTPRLAVAPPPGLAAEPGDVLAWSTDVVQLRAGSFGIVANGKTFGVPADPEISSDPGNLEAWTLEARWRDAGVDQDLNLYFSADATHWWVRQLQVRDGASAAGDKADWVTFRDVVPRTPLGQAYRGDISLVMSAATGPVKVQLDDVRIAVRPNDPVNEPVGGARITLVENGVPAVNGDPFETGGPLRCSGILQLAPQAAEARLLTLGYSLSWRWEYSTGGNTGFAEARDTAPATGWITGTAVGGSGELIVFVTDPQRPTGQPRDLPSDCARP
jgi:hypothetical protein